MKKSGAKFYKTKFDHQWTKEWPFIKMGKYQFHFLCAVCNKHMSCSHQWLFDMKRHVQASSHQAAYKDCIDEKQSSVSSFLATDPIQEKVMAAEVKLTVFLAENHLPMAVADQASQLFKSMFPDSQLAKKITSGRIKASGVLNDAIAEELKEILVTKLRVVPFSIAIDGSNDTGLDKMNPMTVKLFDINSHKVQQRFLDMCTTNSSKTDQIFQKMNDVFKENDLTWNQCVGLILALTTQQSTLG